MPCFAAPQLGRLNLLKDLPGYDNGKGIMVPVRGLADCFDATFTCDGPDIEIARHQVAVRMRLGLPEAGVTNPDDAYSIPMPLHLGQPPRVYAGMTCVPLRPVAEALGAFVEYHDKGPEWERVGCGPIVTLDLGSATVRLLVHRVPPADVTDIVTRLDVKGAWVDDWVMQVLAREGNYAYATEPRYWVVDQHTAPEGAYLESLSGEGADVILGYRGGRWKPLLFFGGVGVTCNILRRAGVPEAIARKFGVKIAPE